MVWLNMAGNDGSLLYLDVFNVEHRRQRGEKVVAVSAVLGDGLFEGQVLLEVGVGVEVTFVDAWLAEERLRDFFARVDREEVEEALEEAARALTGSAGRQAPSPAWMSPHPGGGGSASRVAEDAPTWSAVA
ncbi:MAG: hypothetical protein C0617_02400 [Desulfuromonas sp.]|uniref:hypothetical protein n=1 Tax=Desulfuromonas sp. TaxID=892 RepID=UPI000CA884D4|nr:hypothetical protein [Desulfuromonas sp.]PLX86011.1 MAG: hypothetical protein C0617_02400 [Desulfuromonas sp.]